MAVISSSNVFAEKLVVVNTHTLDTVYLESGQILSVDVESESMPGVIQSFSDSSFVIRSTYVINGHVTDTIVNVPFSEITGITYCTRKRADKCDKNHRYLLPLSTVLGMGAFYYFGVAKNDPRCILFPAGAFIFSSVAGEILKPKFYNFRKRWKFDSVIS